MLEKLQLTLIVLVLMAFSVYASLAILVLIQGDMEHMIVPATTPHRQYYSDFQLDIEPLPADTFKMVGWKTDEEVYGSGEKNDYGYPAAGAFIGYYSSHYLKFDEVDPITCVGYSSRFNRPVSVSEYLEVTEGSLSDQQILEKTKSECLGLIYYSDKGGF